MLVFTVISANWYAFKGYFDYTVEPNLLSMFMVEEDSMKFYFLGVGVTMEQTPPVLPPLQIPVVPLTDMTGTPLSTPASPALSDDSDCLFRLDVDNVRSLLPQDITALPPVLKVVNEGTVMSSYYFITIQ